MEHQGDRGRLGQASEGTGQSACVTPAVWSMRAVCTHTAHYAWQGDRPQRGGPGICALQVHVKVLALCGCIWRRDL